MPIEITNNEMIKTSLLIYEFISEKLNAFVVVIYSAAKVQKKMHICKQN